MEDEECAEHAEDEGAEDVGGADFGEASCGWDNEEDEEPHEVDAETETDGADEDVGG